MDSANGKRCLTTMEGSTACDLSLVDSAATFPAACSSGSQQGGARCLDAFEISLEQAEKGAWYASTLELQLASFRFCLACRRVRTLSVNVDVDMPLSLWGYDDSSDDPHRSTERRQVPALQAAGVTWRIPTDVLVPVLSESILLRGVNWMEIFVNQEHGWLIATVARERSDPMLWQQPLTRQVSSPRRFFEAILCLFAVRNSQDVAGTRFPHRSDGLRLPLSDRQWLVLRWVDCDEDSMGSLQNNENSILFLFSLRQLMLEWEATDHSGGLTSLIPLGGFPADDIVDQLIGWMVLPSSLLELTFVDDFNQSINGVVLPASLLEITFGVHFNQPITSVVWPSNLLKLTFGCDFNQPVVGVDWSAALLELTFGYFFDQPIAGIVWPASLLELTFGESFNQPIDACIWPASLLRLTFVGVFDLPIDRVLWPSSLQSLALGRDFNQTVESVVWPSCLQCLTFGVVFNQPVEAVRWPQPLECLIFGSRFDQAIAEVNWPASLRRLEFGYKFNHAIDGTKWPDSLERLRFGDGFNQNVKGVMWPVSLKELRFGKLFNHPLDGIVWPIALQRPPVAFHSFTSDLE